MTDEREQDRLRAALHEAAEPGERGIDLGTVLDGARRRRRPRVAIAGGALAVALVASGAGLAGGLLPQATMMGASESSDTADAPAAPFSSDSPELDTKESSPQGADSSNDESLDGPPLATSTDVCSGVSGEPAVERGVRVVAPDHLDRSGSTELAVGGVDGPFAAEVLVESIALLDGDRVVAVLLGAGGAVDAAAAAGATTPIDVQGALIGCDEGAPPSGGYEAVATVQVISETGDVLTLRSEPTPIVLG